MISKQSLRTTRCGVALLLSVLLFGCDGGIFGTGDGDVLIVDSSVTGADPSGADNPIEAPDSSITDETNAPPATDSNQGTESLPGFSAAQNSVTSSTGQFGFTNTFSLSGQTATIVELINTTATPVSLYSRTLTGSDFVTETTTTNFLASGSIDPNTSVLQIEALAASGASTLLAAVDPLSVITGTKTQLILRQLTPSVDVIALPVLQANASVDTVALRVVSIALIGDPEVPSVFRFEPTTNATLADSVQFEPLTYASPVSDYRALTAGVYSLTDDAGRYQISNIDLSIPGAVYTLMLDPFFSGQYYLDVQRPQ